MRAKLPDKIERGRLLMGTYASSFGEPYGAFNVMGPCGTLLRILATNGVGEEEVWEHVSVSTERRTPNWDEMCTVKNWFWYANECVAQFHPPKWKYVNNHPYCLHLWLRPGYPFDLPPAIFVGNKSAGLLKGRALREKYGL